MATVAPTPVLSVALVAVIPVVVVLVAVVPVPRVVPVEVVPVEVVPVESVPVVPVVMVPVVGSRPDVKEVPITLIALSVTVTASSRAPNSWLPPRLLSSPLAAAGAAGSGAGA